MLSELCVKPFPGTEDTENIIKFVCHRNRNNFPILE